MELKGTEYVSLPLKEIKKMLDDFPYIYGIYILYRKSIIYAM